MSPATKPIVVPIGVTFSERFLFQDGEGFSFDLTGYTVVAQIRESAASRKKVCDMTGVVNDAATGDFSVSLSAATTALLKPGGYYWDCHLVSASITLCPMAGKATVTPSVSR
jgi:hypothetical protein